MKTYIVYGRAGHYSPDSDIAKHYGIPRLPRKIQGTVSAASANDACAQVAAWFKRQQVEMANDVLGLMPSPLVFEPVAVTEVVPTTEELFAIADQMAAEEAARKIQWAANKAKAVRRGKH